MRQPGPEWALEALSVARIVFHSVDCATGFVRRSDTCGGILGVALAGPQGDWQALISPGDRASCEDAHRKLSPGAPAFEVQCRVRNPRGGEQFWALDRGSAAFDGQGRMTGIRGCDCRCRFRPVRHDAPGPGPEGGKAGSSRH